MRYFLMFLSFVYINTLHAQTITIETKGTYHQQTFSGPSPIANETQYARKQALALAKQAATDEAGSVIYSSFSSIEDSNGKRIVTQKIKNVSAALIRVKVLSEGWKGKQYIVKIQASIDSKDAEKILEKSDARLKEIANIQRENEKLLNALTKLSEDFVLLNKINTHNADELAKNKLYRKQKRKYFEQSEILDLLEENTILMKRSFEKGELTGMLDKNERLLEHMKKSYDKYFMKRYKEGYIVKLFNVDVVKHGNTATVNFMIAMIQDNIYKGIHRETRTFIQNYNKKYTNPYKTTNTFSTLHFKQTDLVKKFSQWIRDNRTMALKVSIGKYSFVTEPIIYMESDYKLMFFENKLTYLTKRRITGIPMQEVQDLDNITVSLVNARFKHSWTDPINETKLKNLGEASEYY